MTHVNTLVFLPESDGSTVGRVCVRCSYPHHREPKLISHWWPLSDRVTFAQAAEFYPELQAAEPQVLHQTDTASYQFRRTSGQYVPLRITGENPGQTQSLHMTETAITCPKVRKGIETRWNESLSRWEKYLKAEGWVTA